MRKTIQIFVILSFLSSYGIHTPSDDVEKGLTLKEAMEVGLEEAAELNEKAMLYIGISVDRDPSAQGMDGRRKHWNLQFGLPYQTDWYLVTIRDGEVDETVHLPKELEKMSERYFISKETFTYDTPVLLIKGQIMAEIYPGDTFAKGYNFAFTKDPQKDLPLVMVIGWDQTLSRMIYLYFNAETGDLEEIKERAQYK